MRSQQWREHDLYQDLLLLPGLDRSSPHNAGGPNTDQFLQVLATLRDFQFRWLLVTRQDVFVHAERLMGSLQGVEPPGGKVVGAWSAEPPRLDPHFFMLPRDVFVLLSAPEVISRLASSGFDVFGDLSVLGAGLSSLMRAFSVDRVQLPGVYQRGGLPNLVCPQGTVTLELHQLSAAPAEHGC